MEDKSIAVVHLVWLPAGMEPFQKFIHSYKKFDAGYVHDLVFIFNGVKSEEETGKYHSFLKEQAITYKSFYLQEGQDIKAYHYVSLQIKHQYICYLNSYVQFLNSNWLAYFMQAMHQDGVGLVGATGSWQSTYTTVFIKHRLLWDKDCSFYQNFRKYKLFIKNILYWRLLFKPFPNPHIRTSSFFIQRSFFIKSYRKEVTIKFQAYQFESGRRGLTAYIRKLGLKPVVIDKYGTVYEEENWPQSVTFFIENQQGLLISDNRTSEYEKATGSEKLALTYLAWGKR